MAFILNFVQCSLAYNGVLNISKCLVISTYNIAMPKSLYLPLWFLHFISTPNLWGHWTDLNQTWTHIYLWLLFEKFGLNSPRHLSPMGWGQKTLFGIDFWSLTEHTSATEHDINNRKEICQSAETPVHASQIWWTLVQKRLRTV